MMEPSITVSGKWKPKKKHPGKDGSALLQILRSKPSDVIHLKRLLNNISKISRMVGLPFRERS